MQPPRAGGHDQMRSAGPGSPRRAHPCPSPACWARHELCKPSPRSPKPKRQVENGEFEHVHVAVGAARRTLHSDGTEHPRALMRWVGGAGTGQPVGRTGLRRLAHRPNRSDVVAGTRRMVPGRLAAVTRHGAAPPFGGGTERGCREQGVFPGGFLVDTGAGSAFIAFGRGPEQGPLAEGIRRVDHFRLSAQ